MNTGPGNRRGAERVTLAGDQFVVVQLPSGEERLEPIVDLSATGVSILLRTSRPDVQPGLTLPRLRLFTNGECTLDTPADVREVTQLSTPEGNIAFKVGLRLERHALAAGQESLADTVLDDTVMNLVAARAAGDLAPIDAAPGQSFRVAFTAVREDKETVVLTLAGSADQKPPLGVLYALATELYGSRLRLELVPIAQEQGELTCRWPERGFLWKQRGIGRVRTQPGRLSVAFESPFTRAVRIRPLSDLSTRGLAFITEPEDGLVVGVLLTGLSVRLDGGVIQGRGIVRNVRRDDDGRLVAGVELIGLSEHGQRLLNGFVTASIHPQVRLAQPTDLKRLWAVYSGVGLFQREHAATSPVLGRIETTRKTLLSRGKEVFVKVVGQAEGDLVGAAELIRTYQGTWTLQHVGALDGARLTIDQLVVPLVEDVVSRRDFKCLHALLEVKGGSQALDRLRGQRPDGTQLWWREHTLVTEGPSYAVPSALGEDIQHAGPPDRDFIIGKLRERWQPLELEALDLTAGQLGLESIGRVFRGLGLERRRLVRMCMSVGGPLGFSLIEQSSAGLNFSGLSDLVRLVPIARLPATRRGALVALAHDAMQLQREWGRRHASLLIEPEHLADLEPAGFVKVATVVEVFAARSAATQVVNFVGLLS